MSNWDLKSEVSRLRSELSRIERENSELQNEINTAVYNINQANKNLTDYNNHVRTSLENANNSINHSINTALGAYELQGQIDQLYTRYKCVELANKNIRALNNKKYYEFNNFRTIRKIVQGIMDNLDVNMVSDRMVYKSIEKQHLVTPDYWLTCVLISIMAWKSDERILAEKAIKEAVKLDRKNSSIFYMIFNMRMDRNEAAVKWFMEYQKCELKGSDANTFLMMFSLISKTLTDTVDDETERMIAGFIHRLIKECAEKQGFSETYVIGFICGRFTALTQSMTYDFPNLSVYCGDYGNIKRMLDLAANNYNILELILKIVNVTAVEKNTYLKEYLEELILKPNEVELNTYNEIERNELIISLGGDKESAERIFAEKKEKREADFDIISTITEWVYDLNNEEVNGQMRLNMFTLTKTFQDKAAMAYFDSYRRMFSTIHPVTIQDYSTEMDFNNAAVEIGKIEEYYRNLQNGELSGIKNLKTYLVYGAGAACGVAAIFTSPLLFSGVGIGAAVGTGMLLSNNSKKKSIIHNYSEKIKSVVDTMHKLFAEFAGVRQVFIENDEVSKKIIDEIAKL